MRKYRFGSREIQSDDPSFPAAVEAAYKNKNSVRAECLCNPPACLPMYVTKQNDRYILKRMPNTGEGHASGCDSYESPATLSGLGQVLGSAIKEDPDSGLVTLKFDFSLSKAAGRAPPAPSDKQGDTVKTDGTRLTLRGTLHYLWDQAGLTRWMPGMVGKRSWSLVRHYLLEAARDKTGKGFDSFERLLYIPEPFQAEKKSEIAQRRITRLLPAVAQSKGPRKLMIAIGEIKALEPSRYGYKIIFKHLPDYPFMLNEDIYNRLKKRFSSELEVWQGLQQSHLISISTFSLGTTHVASIEEIALMNVTENWIPFEGMLDKVLIDAMTEDHQRFTKGLRYNMPAFKPLACLSALDTTPPTAMYIVQPGSGEEHEAELNELIDSSTQSSWLWVVEDGEMPLLPRAH